MKKISVVTNSQLEKDVNSFLEIYPSYSYHKPFGKKYSKIKGEIDVCDTEGNYLDSFAIEILLNNDRYPYIIPIVRECSKKIERHEDWHIDNNGYCCLDIEHVLEFKAKQGIKIVEFYQNCIYPFFANTLYKMNFGKYSNGEYSHFFNGVTQFYEEKLMLTDSVLIIKILKAILNNTIPGRNNRPCICGLDKKFKKCHLESFNFLQFISKERLIKDLTGFENLNVTTSKTM